ncbi:MAG: hypothetical protein H7Y20_05715 [Bryobacteraceae bacterium]|nr:hypothetical protein [Bryobacteraceae bacterium]
MTRRQLGVLLAGSHGLRGASALPPVRAVTKGPKFHWFGYYDKWQFDVQNRYVLGMQSGFEHRSPSPEDRIRVGMIDLKDNDRWIDLGESLAWGWQQGCMLQWLPGSGTEIIWNDREDGQYVSRILDVKSGKKRTIGAPVYAISPDGSEAVAPDFRRLHDLRPGYGYAGIADPGREVAAPSDAGIWHTDLRSGKTRLILPFSQVAAIAAPGLDMANSRHWFNHLLYSPTGARFIFLHRWQGKQHRTFQTRMFTAAKNAEDLFVLDPHGKTSHFIWRDPQNVLAWAWHPSQGDKFYLYKDKTSEVQAIGAGVMTVNGHCTYLPGLQNRWILNDTYPDKERLQHVYLYDTASEKRIALGDFLSPPEYAGEWRCDTHPRFSRDGKSVVIDSTHEGKGRQLYLIDVGAVVG